MVCSQFIISKLKKKTQYVQFMTKNASAEEIYIGCKNMFISDASNTKFLGLVITNSLSLSWKDHITQLTPTLCKAYSKFPLG